MPQYTNPAILDKIKIAAKTAADVLDLVCKAVKPGVSLKALDDIAAERMAELGATSSSLNYPSPHDGVEPFPGHICLSLNDEIVHGIPLADKILADGDIVAVDVALEKDGYIGDNARTVAVGPISPEVEKLLSVTKEALDIGIAQAKNGGRVGDIGEAIQKFVESNGFSVIREFVGHGVGREMHEEPQIPNYGQAGRGPVLKKGMVLAIEPMVNMGAKKIEIDPDGWTVRTRDGKPSAHFEHTILITKHGPEVLTTPPSA